MIHIVSPALQNKMSSHTLLWCSHSFLRLYFVHSHNPRALGPENQQSKLQENWSRKQEAPRWPNTFNSIFLIGSNVQSTMRGRRDWMLFSSTWLAPLITTPWDSWHGKWQEKCHLSFGNLTASQPTPYLEHRPWLNIILVSTYCIALVV